MKMMTCAGGLVAVLLCGLICQGCAIVSDSEEAAHAFVQMDKTISRWLDDSERERTTEIEDFAGRFVDRYDANRDGSLTASELPGDATGMMILYDLDGNGVIDVEEILDCAVDWEHVSMDPGIDSPWSDAANVQLYRALDLDGDDALTVEETPDILWASIVCADTNGDGKVTHEELTEADRRNMARVWAAAEDNDFRHPEL